MKGLHAGRSVGAASDRMLIAAGPLSKQPMTLPYRVVLLEKQDGSFVVHNETFINTQIIDLLQVTQRCEGEFSSSLSSGDYFDKSEATAATRRFAERVAQNAGYLKSIYAEQRWEAEKAAAT